jgi:UDP-N-acetylglucosamine 2-epimerase
VPCWGAGELLPLSFSPEPGAGVPPEPPVSVSPEPGAGVPPEPPVSRKNVRVIEPVGYLDFIKLIANAGKIITDSGGIQKEAYLLWVPCITIRKSTEMVETVKEGWNKLTDTNTERIVRAVKSWHRYNRKRPNIFGSGKTSSVIRDILLLSQDLYG